MKPPVVWIVAGAVGVALTLLLNRLGVWWLGATVFTSHSFYDGNAAFLTLLIPALIGGLPIGFLAREQGLARRRRRLPGVLRAGLHCTLSGASRRSPRSRRTAAGYTTSCTTRSWLWRLGRWGRGRRHSSRRVKWTLTDPEPVVPQE